MAANLLIRCRLGVALMISVAVLASNILAEEAPMRHPDCPPVDDPLHPVYLPHLSDCSKYYTCSGGMAYAMTCPSQFQWSILTYRCDYIAVAKCYNKQGVTSSSPPNSSPTMYQSYAGDCNKFLSCTVMNCPPAQHWNAMLNRCDTPLAAECSATTASLLVAMTLPTAATPPAYSKPPQIDATTNSSLFPHVPLYDEMNALCNGPGISYAHYPNDCQKFIQCNGVAYVHTCPADLFWNSELLTCDHICK